MHDDTPAATRGDASADAVLESLTRQWESAIENQRHFNNIEWKIRALALTAISAILTVVSATRVTAAVELEGGLTIPSASFMLAAAAGIWYIFFFVDYYWYHPLLRASTTVANDLEKAISEITGTRGLSTTITDGSHNTWLGVSLNSTRKLQVFYLLGAAMLSLSFMFTILIENS